MLAGETFRLPPGMDPMSEEAKRLICDAADRICLIALKASNDALTQAGSSAELEWVTTDVTDEEGEELFDVG